MESISDFFKAMGSVGSPALSAISLAFNLSPICEITFADGPIQTRPDCSTELANLAFSERNP